ncbi:MAG: lysophospholipid acyltransferase family protein [Gemmatimonadota bacterium]|nr:lysophospholipid acyltransferase family protein [Gemmatimonadota bacterium]
MIRLLAVLAVIAPLTIWHAARILWAMAWKSPRLPCVCEDVPRAWSGFLLRVTGVRVVVENEEAIDPDRPQILAVNHASWFDVLALATGLPGSYRFVAKKEIERAPLFGPSIRRCGHIFIDREDRQKALATMERARDVLEKERPTIIMFPEGTRSETGELQRFKKGAFVLGIQTGTEIVPAAIVGSREVMPKGSLKIRPGVITVRLGDPIPVQGLEVADRDTLTRRAHEAVAGLLTPSH